MKCGFCDREIPDAVDPDRPRCGRCSGGCRMIHCPSCGYENPAPPEYLKRWLKKGKPEKE